MKTLSRSKAFQKLKILKDGFRTEISPFEQRAKNCLTCEEQGICCTDAHFVNVHVTRLEAEAMNESLKELPAFMRARVVERITNAVADYGLRADDRSFERTYSCPLFEPGLGCLVHDGSKPLPCIHHACYERVADLPPDTLLESAESGVERLNARTYGNAWNWLPIPLALLGADGNDRNES